MLIEKIQKSRDLGIKYDLSNVSETHLRTANHLYTELLSRIHELHQLFLDSEIIKSIYKDPIYETGRLFLELTEIKNEIGTLSNDNERITNKLNSIDNLKNQAKKNMILIWDKYREDNYEPSANMIESLIGLIDSDARLNELKSLGSVIESKEIGDKDTISNIEQYKEMSQRIIKDLNMNPEIEDFISKLGNGEVTVLSELTDSMLRWLNDHNISSKIKLIL